VIDGPRVGDYRDWQLEASSGDSVALSCAATVSHGTPLVGERGDSWVVNLRLQTALGSSPGPSSSYAVRRTGYRELANALWKTHKSKSCQHHPRLGETVVLEPGIAAVSGFGDFDQIKVYGDVVICLTACGTAARWRALISLAQQIRSRGIGYPVIMLRRKDCCFACVIKQTLKHANPDDIWCIIL
jgi:hypothetical protein